MRAGDGCRVQRKLQTGKLVECASPILRPERIRLTLARLLAIPRAMRHIVRMVVAIRFALSTRRDLLLESLALRHQLHVLIRSNRRFRPSDRLLWLVLRQLWPRWRHALVLVLPATVDRWHREGFHRCWPPLATSGQTTDRFRMSRLDSALGRRQLSLGRSANPRRITQARNRRL